LKSLMGHLLENRSIVQLGESANPAAEAYRQMAS
jgi:hypothetical protein